MNDSYTITRIHADPAAATALQAVEHDSLSDSDLTVAELCAVLSRPEQRTYLAYGAADGGPVPVGGQSRDAIGGQSQNAIGGLSHPAIGFCFCLLTDAAQGPRLEIDMLGVLPDHRGRGVARRLVAHAMAGARDCGVRRFRGVVAEDNLASRRVFERLGFTAPAEPHTMRVYPLAGLAPVPFLPAGWRWTSETIAGGGLDGAVPREIHRLFAPGATSSGDAPAGESECLEVHTLSYSGLWIERLWAADAVALRLLALGAVERAKRSALDEVGYLRPAELAAAQDEVLIGLGYDAVGRYLVLQVDHGSH